MKIICDSSSLILLEKAGILGVLADKCKITVPNQVYKETVEEGLKRNLVDAVKINELIKSKKIIVNEVNKAMNFPMSLGRGEKESIELFYQENADKIAVDDKKVFNICNILKIPYREL